MLAGNWATFVNPVTTSLAGNKTRDIWKKELNRTPQKNITLFNVTCYFWLLQEWESSQMVLKVRKYDAGLRVVNQNGKADNV